MASTPLHEAAREGHATTAEVLVKAGADVKAKNNVRSRRSFVAMFRFVQPTLDRPDPEVLDVTVFGTVCFLDTGQRDWEPFLFVLHAKSLTACVPCWRGFMLRTKRVYLFSSDGRQTHDRKTKRTSWTGREASRALKRPDGVFGQRVNVAIGQNAFHLPQFALGRKRREVFLVLTRVWDIAGAQKNDDSLFNVWTCSQQLTCGNSFTSTAAVAGIAKCALLDGFRTGWQVYFTVTKRVRLLLT